MYFSLLGSLPHVSHELAEEAASASFRDGVDVRV
jgi:hypothetical protein